MTINMIIAVVLFVIAYGLIITDKFSRASIVLVTASVIIALKIIPNQKAAFEYLDLNTIYLLIGMMVLASVIKRSGLFQYMAIEAVKLTGKNPKIILIVLSAVIAITSAFLDNVTTILLLIPMILAITDTLKLDPAPFVISGIISSNIGGTATAVGDPPNIMIASQAKLSFMDFILNVAPATLISFVIIVGLLLFIYRKKLVLSEEVKEKNLQFVPSEAITNKSMLIKSVIILSFTIFMFMIHHVVDIELATIALGSSSLLVIISDVSFTDVVKDVEWETILFFTGLFIMVGGLQSTGVLEGLSKFIISLSRGSYFMASTSILWGSALISAFVDNIPYTAIMIPVISSLPFHNLHPLWWSLSLGACLGGNGTIIGASANVVATAAIFTYCKRKITFVEFFKVGFPLMIMSILISNIYLYLRYLI